MLSAGPVIESAESRGRKRIAVLEPILIFVFSCVFLVITMNRAVSPYDESLVLEGAVRTASGAILHRDFYANYGPAQFYVLAALFKAFGTSVLVERAWDTVVRAGIVTVCFLLMSFVYSRREGLIAAGVSLIWVTAVQFYSFPLFPALLCALIAAACQLPLFRGEWSGPLQFASGISLGLAVLFRYDVGFYGFLAINAVIFVFALTREEIRFGRLFTAVRTILPCCFGLSVICIPVAFAYVTFGIVSDFSFDIIYYPSHFYAEMRSLPFPGPEDVLHSVGLSAIYLPPVLWICGVLVIVDMLRHDEGDRSTPLYWALILFETMSILFYLKGLVRVAVIHMTLSIVPALLIAIICLQYSLRLVRSPTKRWITPALVVGVVFAGLLTIQMLRQPVRIAAENLTSVAQGDLWKAPGDDYATGTCRPLPSLARLACFETDADRAHAISYIVAHSQPTDTIFEGLPHYDKIFVNDMLVYFATGLRPATKWYHFDPGLQTSRDTQAAMIEEMRAAKPRFVVVDSRWDNMSEPNGSSVSSGVTLLSDFIADRYHPVQKYGAVTLLQLNDE